MATASTSGQSSFGLGRKKKKPGLMDQITKFFGGDKKKRSKVSFHASASKGSVQGSFRGHGPASPQQSSARRRTKENAVVHFFRSLVTSPQPKSRWRDALGLASSPRAESTKSPVRRRRDQSTLSRIFNLGDTKSRPPPKRWSTIF
ncbi:myelin basic protein isoform X1 [Eleginops maclovinus]|uniref:myelin basic protein isoform X1 n=2 Tax=Eleginops maclovinus TaxID=56733 RepID=UPI0030807AF2